MIYGRLTLTLLALSSSCLGQQTVEEKLDLAKSRHRDTVASAKAELIEQIQKKIALLSKAGNGEALKELEGELVAFQEDGVLPRSLPTRGYEAKVTRSVAQLEQAYNEAIAKYSKAGERELANHALLARDELVFQQFAGKWVVDFKGISIHEYEIDSKGNVRCNEVGHQNVAKLYRNGKDVLLDWAQGKVERLTITGGRLIVEHWFPADGYTAGRPPGFVGQSE